LACQQDTSQMPLALREFARESGIGHLESHKVAPAEQFSWRQWRSPCHLGA